MPVSRDVNKNPDRDKDPFRYFMKHNNPGGKTLIFFAHIEENGTNGRTGTVMLNKEDEFQDDNSREELISWARYLGRPFYRRGRGADKRIGENEDDVESVAEYAIQKCDSPGFRFLCNFANDRTLNCDSDRTSIETSTDSEADVLACFAAHNLIQQTTVNQRALNQRKVPPLQMAIGCMLHTHGCSRPVFEKLSRFRVSASLSLVKKLNSRGNVKFLEGLRVPMRWDLLVYCHDNIDWLKNKGSKMENWVVQTVKCVAKDDALLAPCYNGKLDTAKKSIDDIIKDSKNPFTEIAGIRDIDCRRLTFYRLCHIEYCIAHPFCQVDKIGRMTQMEKLKRHPPPLQNLGIDVRAQMKWTTNGERIDFKLRRYNPLHLPDDYEEVDHNHQNLLARNGLTVDIPVQLPMAEKDTVLGFLEQFLATRQSQMKEIGKENEDTVEDLEPLASKYILYVADGSPVYLAYRFKDEDAKTESPRFKAISVFPGAFHYMKEIVTQSAKLMEEFRRDLVKTYRPTQKEQDFVMFPKDPRKFEEEAVPYLAAKYRSAIEECAKATKTTILLATEVYDYMMEESSKKWYAQVELTDIALHEIYFMIRDAVRANESELFFSAVRLSLPLFAKTNAFHYLRIGFDLLLWRETASQEELYLFEVLAFTRSTEYGEFQAVDLCQEKVNKKFRERLPAKAGVGFARKMKNRAIELNMEAAKSNGGEPAGDNHDDTGTTKAKTTIFNKKHAEVGWEKVYSAVRCDMDQKQVWKRGAPVQFKSNPKKAEAPMKAVPDNLITGPSWKLMSNEIMDWLTKGSDRCEEYCDSFYTCPKEYRNQVERPKTYDNGGVPTTKIMATEEAYKQFSEKRVKLATSVNADEIVAAADRTKHNIMAAIRHTRSLLVEPPPENPAQKDTLKGWSTELVRLRKLWIAEEVKNKNTSRKDLISDLKQKEKERGALTSQALRDKIVESTGFFYKSHPEVKTEFELRNELENLF